MQRAVVASLVCSVLGLVGGRAAPAQEQQAPTYKGGVDLVTVSVVVNNRDGRPVTGLSRTDFDLFDAGVARSIAVFRTEPAPINIAVLLDASGSMRIGRKWSAAQDVMRTLAAMLEPGRDRVALFTFDTQLHESQPFTTAPADAVGRLDSVRPFGSTALYDAIAQIGRQLAAQIGSRRAVVVVTDGVDNHSQLNAADVAGIASAIDMPVYAVVVASPLDRPGAASEAGGPAPQRGIALDDLTRWTGGAVFAGGTPAEATVTARQIVVELRNQYLITFESSTPAGWHPIMVRVHNDTLVVRTRSGYMAGLRANAQH